MKKSFGLVLVLIFALTLPQSLKAQFDEDTDSSLGEAIRTILDKDYFDVGALVQVVGDYQPERNRAGQNGFSVANARVKLTGNLNGGFSYAMQTKLDRSPAILDAKISWRHSPMFSVSSGIFKTPFSGEYLTGAGAIDFVNRSTVVQSLAPKRSIGLQISGQTESKQFSYAVGAFNGNSPAFNQNDNSNLMYVGRVAYQPLTDQTNQLQFGLNAAYSDDNNVRLSNIPLYNDGTRFVMGADARFSTNKFLLSGEWIYSSLDQDQWSNFIQPGTYHPSGFHATAGYKLSDNTQLLVRWDQFSADVIGSDTEQLIAGFNFWPTEATEFQLNYVLDTQTDVENSQLLVNFQLGF